MIAFLERSPQIRSCIHKLTLRRRSPVIGALLPFVESQWLVLLSSQYLPSLQHLSLINVLFLRPFADEMPRVNTALVPPLESLHIHIDRNRTIYGADILYLLSHFQAIRNLSFAGCPALVDPEPNLFNELAAGPYRLVQPRTLRLTKLSSYLPLLRACSPALWNSLSAFKAGLFDVHAANDTEAVALRQVFNEVCQGESCDDVTLYYTLLDRNDRCKLRFHSQMSDLCCSLW